MDVLDKTGLDALSPTRTRIDHQMILQKVESGREKFPPWGPLHNMNQEGLAARAQKNANQKL